MDNLLVNEGEEECAGPYRNMGTPACAEPSKEQSPEEGLLSRRDDDEEEQEKPGQPKGA